MSSFEYHWPGPSHERQAYQKPPTRICNTSRTTRHEGYAISERTRKRVEEVFGWIKTIALQRKTRFRGPDRTGWMFTLAAAAYNLVRIRNLQTGTV